MTINFSDITTLYFQFCDYFDVSKKTKFLAKVFLATLSYGLQIRHIPFTEGACLVALATAVKVFFLLFQVNQSRGLSRTFTPKTMGKALSTSLHSRFFVRVEGHLLKFLDFNLSLSTPYEFLEEFCSNSANQEVLLTFKRRTVELLIDFAISIP